MAVDDGVKQRIIGAFVLLALVVIFVPVFFDRERMPPVDRTSQIPLAPEFIDEESVSSSRENAPEDKEILPADPVGPDEVKERDEVKEKVSMVAVATVKPTMPPDKSVPASRMFVPDDRSPHSPEPVAPKLNNKGVPEGWVIQVASYRIDGHAKKMRDDLISMGLKAYVRDVKTKGGNMTRVYVGPKLDKARLVEAQKTIDEKYKIKTILTRFEP